MVTVGQLWSKTLFYHLLIALSEQGCWDGWLTVHVSQVVWAQQVEELSNGSSSYSHRPWQVGADQWRVLSRRVMWSDLSLEPSELSLHLALLLN